MRSLLDVNVLVALLDGAHLHHRVATDWLAAHVAQDVAHLAHGAPDADAVQKQAHPESKSKARF